MMIDTDRYMTLRRAAETSGYNYIYLSKLVKSGKVASIAIDDRTRLVDIEDLKRYTQERISTRFPGDKTPQPA